MVVWKEKEFVDYIMNLLLIKSSATIRLGKDLTYCFKKLDRETKDYGYMKELRVLLLKLLKDEELTKREEKIIDFKCEKKKLLGKSVRYEFRSIIIDLLYNSYEENKEDLKHCHTYLEKISKALQKK